MALTRRDFLGAAALGPLASRALGEGAKLQAKGSALTRSRIALATQGWTAADRARFAELFARFVEEMLPRATGDRRTPRAPGERTGQAAREPARGPSSA